VAEAGRVIAGKARGIRLLAPGAGTRPLGDRVKQTLFAILAPDLPGSAVLDLCAGSGAAGIEALSRGATRAVFVEREAAVARAIVENLRRTGLDGPGVQVVITDAVRYLAGEAGAVTGPFDIIVLDPPYAQPALLGRLLEALGADASGRLLANGGTVVAKHFWRDAPPPTVGLLASVRDRRFGETGLTFYRREGG
jgi:16S rRNA (guanine966-N2)-methyltransferase